MWKRNEDVKQSGSKSLQSVQFLYTLNTWKQVARLVSWLCVSPPEVSQKFPETPFPSDRTRPRHSPLAPFSDSPFDDDDCNRLGPKDPSPYMNRRNKPIPRTPTGLSK